MPEVSLADFRYLVPEIVLAVSGMLLLVAGSFGRGIGHRVAGWWSFVTLLVTGALTVGIQGGLEEPLLLLGANLVLDPFSLFWKVLVLVATILTLGLSARFVAEGGYRAGEFYSLLLLATTGMMFMASGYNLLSIWISLELMALSSYVLAGYFKRQTRSNEAALKYFVLGGLSSGILLYGVSLLYGATGEIRLDALAATLPAAIEGSGMLVTAGWLLLAIGLLFKVAAVPFHIWTPDVYVGAPTPVTAYLAVASKAASFAILVRILYQGLPPLELDWQLVLAAISAVTMIWGNLAALTQTNVKRLLAYSSIAHAGYILMGVLATSALGQSAVIYYLLAYSFITMGTFGTVALLERREYAGETLADYAGLARRAPALAAMMVVFLIALTGIPPTGGFVGKLFVFAAAVETGWTWLAVIGVVTSAISLYYYFGIVVHMYLRESDRGTPEPMRSPVLVGTIALCAVATLILGIAPRPFLELAQASLLSLP